MTPKRGNLENDLGRKRNKLLEGEKKIKSLGGLEPPTSRLTVERANQLRHKDNWWCKLFF